MALLSTRKIAPLDAAFDVFKSFHKGNPEVERAFEMFRAFNKDLMTAQDENDERLVKKACKDKNFFFALATNLSQFSSIPTR